MALNISFPSIVAGIVAVVYARGSAAFQPSLSSQYNGPISASVTTPVESSLDAISRREALAAASLVVAGTGVPLEAFAADTTTKKKPKPNYDFNGLFKDPNHPLGYRILAGAVGKKGASLMMQDEPDGPVLNIPMTSDFNEKGKVILTMDFSVKGGPSDVVATVGKDYIAFPDGNKWKKQKDGLVGVYIDGFAPYPKYRRIIRESTLGGGSDNLVVELISGKNTFLCSGRKASKNEVVIDFPGDKTCTGSVSLKKGVIQFPDGNIWTKV